MTVAGGEHPTKMIMTSLTVVPRRGQFYAARATAGLLAAAGTVLSLVIMLAWTVAALVGGYLVLVRTDVSGGSRRRRTPAQAR